MSVCACVYTHTQGKFSLALGCVTVYTQAQSGLCSVANRAQLPKVSLSLSRSIELNGRVLRMLDDETLPELMEKPLGPGSLLGLPAFSYGFYVIKNAKAIACI